MAVGRRTPAPLSPSSGREQQFVDQVGLWLPKDMVAINHPAGRAPTTEVDPLTSGTLYLAGGAVVPAEATVTKIGFCSGSTAADTPLNQWFCLVDAATLNVLAKTVDDEDAAWAADTVKELAITLTPYREGAVDRAVYIGICVVATDPPDLVGLSTHVELATLPPITAGDSDAALTDPSTLGATATAPTPNALQPVAWLRGS